MVGRKLWLKLQSLCGWLLLSGEIVLFVGLCVFGERGLRATRVIKRECTEIRSEIALLENDMAQINDDMRLWCSHDFYKEKVAREKLQMAHSEETIFYTA